MPMRASWSVIAATAAASTPGVVPGALMVFGATAPIVESVFG